MYGDLINSMPEFAGLGQLFTSSKPVELTESEAEYCVSCVKHAFPQHLLFQFTIRNTMEELQLEQVAVEMDLSDAGGTEVETVVKAEECKFETPAVCWVAVKRPAANSLEGMFVRMCKLTFTQKEVDPQTGEVFPDGEEEEYPLDELEVTLADLVRPLPLPDFRAAWDAMVADNDVTQVFRLDKHKAISDAVTAIVGALGMDASDGSDTVSAAARTHRLLLSGTVIGEQSALIRADLRVSPSNAIEMKLSIRSQAMAVSEAVLEAVSS